MVLGRRPHHGRSANVDVLYGHFFGAIRPSHGFGKRIKINHHQIDRGDVVITHGIAVYGPTAEDAAMNFRMQGFYPAVHHFRETGMFRHLGDRNARFGERPIGAAGGKNLYTSRRQLLRKFRYTRFI